MTEQEKKELFNKVFNEQVALMKKMNIEELIEYRRQLLRIIAEARFRLMNQ